MQKAVILRLLKVTSTSRGRLNKGLTFQKVRLRRPGERRQQQLQCRENELKN